MINNDFIFLIMNCKKYVKKAQIQKNTWLKTLPANILYYHVIGDTNLNCEYIFDNSTNILFVNVPDDYNSLPKKVIAAFNAINKTFNYKYIFKSDDDQMLTQHNFFEMICNFVTKKTPKTHYGGFVVDVRKAHFSDYHKIHPELPKNLPIQVTKYCSGRFYFLSFEAIQNLINKKEQIQNEYFEDYAIGFYLDLQFKNYIQFIDTNKYFIDIEKTPYINLLT